MRLLLIVVALAFSGLIGGSVILYSGIYNVAATKEHLTPTHWLLETGMRRSVQRRAAQIEVPPLDDPVLRNRGALLARRHCVDCHGAPGVAPAAFALGLTPLPANLAHTAREWKPAELYWVIRNGIKMAGMPAWEFRMPDKDLWAIVAHLRQLPQMSPAQYAALMRDLDVRSASAPMPQTEPEPVAEPDPKRGKKAIQQYACVTCHLIPGIVGANAPVGPPLNRYASRALVAGMLSNTPENLVLWLREPRRLNPQTAMPDLGLSERDARDIAAYLHTLR